MVPGEDHKALSPCPDDPSQIGRAPTCSGCPGQAYCQRNSSKQNDQEREQLIVRMSTIKHKIVVMSGKGGVGKSTVAAQIARGLFNKGYKVGILDVDICGPSIPKLFDCENGSVVNNSWGWTPVTVENGIIIMSIAFILNEKDTPVVWRGPRKTTMITRFLRDTFWGRLDYLVIDTPPGTSDEHLSTVAALAETNPDGCVMVTTPQDLALDTIKKQISFCRKLKIPILGIVENMSGFICPCCGEIYHIWKEGGGEKVSKEFGISFLGSIPIDPCIAMSAEKGKTPFTDSSNTFTTKSLLSIVDGIYNLVINNK